MTGNLARALRGVPNLLAGRGVPYGPEARAGVSVAFGRRGDPRWRFGLVASALGALGAIASAQTTSPPAVNLVTTDPTPAAGMSWWLLPLVLGLVGAAVGGCWWWWRHVDALERDPAAWATKRLLAAQPRARRGQLKAAARQRGVPVLALLVSEHAAGRALGALKAE